MKRQQCTRRWSNEATRHSDALDLEPGVFRSASPSRIASWLKRSAEASSRRKVAPYQSGISMLNFYINRAGSNLPDRQHSVLLRAKLELRKSFGRDK